MSSLHIAFNYLVDRLHEVKTVKHVRVKDEGALTIELEQPGFIERVVIYLLAGELSLGFIKKAIAKIPVERTIFLVFQTVRHLVNIFWKIVNTKWNIR